MKKPTMLMIVAPVLALTVLGIASGQKEGREDREPPKFLKAEDQRPAKRPAEYEKVAVLSLVLHVEDGAVQGVEVKSVKIISSFAPKVFARSAGDWKVMVKGERPESFLVNNPLNDIEIENPRGSKTPYSRVRLSGPVDWTLVVPLYKDGQSLGAQSIDIVDVPNDRTLLSVELDDGQYRKK